MGETAHRAASSCELSSTRCDAVRRANGRRRLAREAESAVRANESLQRSAEADACQRTSTKGLSCCEFVGQGCAALTRKSERTNAVRNRANETGERQAGEEQSNAKPARSEGDGVQTQHPTSVRCEDRENVRREQSGCQRHTVCGAKRSFERRARSADARERAQRVAERGRTHSVRAAWSMSEMAERSIEGRRLFSRDKRAVRSGRARVELQS